MASTLPNSTMTNQKTGAGTTIDFLAAKSRVSLVLIPSGTISSGMVTVEASQDGSNWVTLEYLDPTLGTNQQSSPPNAAFRFWRANLVSPITGGGTVSATLMEAN